jgi:hypothetical protein
VSTTLQSFVLETLRHRHIEVLNFQFGALRVYPSGYSSDIASSVETGAIRLTSDWADTGASAPLSHDGAFAVDTAAGTSHPFFVHSRWTEVASEGLCVRETLSSREQAHLRGVIVHESTHALQDWQRVAPNPRTAEGAAYLAGAITSRLWGFAPIGGVANPRASGLAFAMDLSERFLSSTVGARYVISATDVSTLESLVTIGAPARYLFNGL